jgi:urease accessory protein
MPTVTHTVTVMTETASLSLLRVCQLVSPALPIGSYNFSQGLEYAAHAGWVHDEASTLAWIRGVASHSVCTLDLPLLLRMHAAWTMDDAVAARRWSTLQLAARESAEQRAEERHLGRALAKVLCTQGIAEATAWIADADASYPCLFALAASRWNISAGDTAQAYLWAWSENQVLAALKLLPIGQSAGQRLLGALLPLLPELARKAASVEDEDIGMATPVHGMACAWHETQYTRLFRS